MLTWGALCMFDNDDLLRSYHLRLKATAGAGGSLVFSGLIVWQLQDTNIDQRKARSFVF